MTLAQPLRRPPDCDCLRLHRAVEFSIARFAIAMVLCDRRAAAPQRTRHCLRALGSTSRRPGTAPDLNRMKLYEFSRCQCRPSGRPAAAEAAELAAYHAFIFVYTCSNGTAALCTKISLSACGAAHAAVIQSKNHTCRYGAPSQDVVVVRRRLPFPNNQRQLNCIRMREEQQIRHNDTEKCRREKEIQTN